MNILTGFASVLRQKRKNCGYTQKQLAEIIGYSEKSVSKWESADALPPSVILPKLSEALHVSIDDLFEFCGEPAYFLGIDGGGTKTEFVLTDKEGIVINHITLGETNPVDIGFDNACQVLDSGIREVCGDISHGKISVFAGIAGGITGENKQKISEFLKRYRFCRYDNGSDAQNAVEAALLDGDGITVILGTGDIAFTRVGDSLYRTGGYGYLFDTGGSGYSIGRDAILESLNCEQNGTDATILLDMLKKHLGKSSLLDSLSDLYDGGKKKIATVAPLVFDAYKTGDETAITILERNFAAVAKLIIDAARHISNVNITVRLVGSISQNDCVVALINKHIMQLDTKRIYNISVCSTAPVIGALRLAGMKKEIQL